MTSLKNDTIGPHACPYASTCIYDAFALLAKRYEGEGAVFSSRAELVRTLSNPVVEPALRSLPSRQGQAHLPCYVFMRLHPSTSLRGQGMFTTVQALFSWLRGRQSCTTVKGRTWSTLPARRPKHLVARGRGTCSCIP